jgi:uncharacterized protein (TIGR03118 family)
MMGERQVDQSALFYEFSLERHVPADHRDRARTRWRQSGRLHRPGVGASGGATYLYAANNITGTIDVYDTSFTKVALSGSFVDPGPNPDGRVPYNIENIGVNLWVTYAVPGPSASSAPLGSGFVSVFKMDGTFVRRFATGGKLSSPWVVTIAPANFGKYSNDVLIGNFNDGPTEGFIKRLRSDDR